VSIEVDFMKKIAVAFAALCCILLITAAACFATSNDTPEQIELDNQQYFLFSSCLDELGYGVGEEKSMGGSTPDGHRITEYKYTLKDDGEIKGALTVTVCAGEVMSVWGDGDVVSVLHINAEQDVAFADGNVYISEQAFSEAQEILAVSDSL
jgi:hypothetical protein